MNKIQQLFREHRTELIQQWVEAVFSTLPLESKGFLRTQTDPFANPVANMTREAAEVLYDAVAGEETEIARVKGALERFVKLRAVQKDTPSRNLGIFFLMKPLLREKILPVMLSNNNLEAYLEAESRLDSLLLLALDMYNEARETLADIRIAEIKNQYAELKRWAQQLNADAPLNFSEK